jgi:hypothetical protein
MKLFARLALILVLVTMAVGPLTAATVSLSSGAHLTAPTGTTGSAVLAVVKVVAYGLAVFGAIQVKDNSAIAAKYVARAGVASKDYTDGVANAGGAWETGAKNGEGNFEQGVQDAIQRKAYGKGVTGSAGKYVANATKLGAVRYGPGVQNGAGAYQAGVAPYLEKLRSLTLPPKGPRRSPQNQQRANMVAAELGKLKVGS